jgi:hypothetical protein
MKKLLAALLLTSSVAFAAETVVIDVPTRDLGTFTRLESQFHVDMENGQVAGILTSVLDREVCRWEYGGAYGGGWGGMGGYGPYPGPYGRPYPGPVSRYVCFRTTDDIASKTAILDDLMVVDNQIIMKAAAGDVVCANLKKGRIFKNTIKIILNGNCTLTDRVVRAENGEKHAQLVLVTK